VCNFGYASNFHWTHDTGYYLEKRKTVFRELDKTDDEEEEYNREGETAFRQAPPKYGTFAKLGTSSGSSSDNDGETHVFAYHDTTRFNPYLAPEIVMDSDHNHNCDW
jgi:hypothetical protein